MAPQSVVALRRCRSMLGCATVAALLMSSAATAAANHTGSGAAGDGHEVTSLVVQVAEASQELADLAAGIQQRQEDVNKALLQVGGTRAAAARAADAVVASQRALDDAGAQIVAAQRRFDHFAASTYLNGPSDGYVTATSPEDLIAAAAAGRTLEVASAQARDDLQRARTEQTNRQSAARAAQRDADTAAADAQHSLDAAVATLTAAHDDFTAQQATVTAVAARRDTAQAQLRAAQSHPVEQPAPTPAAASPSSPLWDRRTDPAPPNRGQWDTTLPMVPSANIAGDPVAVINAVLQLSATSAQATATMGRTFLVKLGILPAAAAAADPGLTNGRIPRVYGRQASEYVIRRAMSQIGVPYSWGGGSAAGPSRGIDGGAGTVGFDCSGLMLYAFAGVGIKLDHYSGSQYNAGRKIPAAQMRRGDLLFYGPSASQHEAMYLGEGMMLEAQQTGVPVKVSPLRTSGMMPYVTRLIDY